MPHAKLLPDNNTGSDINPDVNPDAAIDSQDSGSDGVVTERDDISNYNPEQILPQPEYVIQQIQSWLQPTAYDAVGSEYRRHLTSHLSGTGVWLTSSSAYQDWLRKSDNGLLWIKGIPGSGKSVMAASLIQQLSQSNPASPVLFFFFRQIIHVNHQPEALLRDWMAQVLEYSPPLQKQLNSYVEMGRSLESISMTDMWKHLRMAFSSLPGKVFCVADALDEMDLGNEAFLKDIADLGLWKPDKVKVLITSRPVPSVEAPLHNSRALDIRLQEQMVDRDISTFVQHGLSISTLDRNDWKVIAESVPGRANGLFLYAKLAMDAFLEPGADVDTVLSMLPADLNALYTDLLREHAHRSGVDEHLQRLILQSVTHATRPLRLLELAELIRASSDQDSARSLKDTKDLIRAACGPLLEILADETVTVIHHSFTEYLKGTTRHGDDSGYAILQMGPTHVQLAVACLRYLQSGCLESVQVATEDEMEMDEHYDQRLYNRAHGYLTEEEIKLRLEHPFLSYAAANWHHHINKSEAAGYDQSEVLPALEGFLAKTGNVKAWLQLQWPDGALSAAKVTQLHISAKTGLASYTDTLIAKHLDLNVGDSKGKTPLWWAASEGHASEIHQLISAGADPDREDSRQGLTPLHQAASNNHGAAVTVLLQAGVDPLTEKKLEEPGRLWGNASRTKGHTALMYACKNGHLEAVNAFLCFFGENKAHLHIVHRALAWAAEYGRSTLVSRILQYPGVDVNAKVRGDTPLFLACRVMDVATVKTLLEAGADPRIGCEDLGDEFAGIGGNRMRPVGVKDDALLTCLHQMCGMGIRSQYQEFNSSDLQTIFSLLIQAGVDVHQRGTSGATALHGAVNSPVLVRLLLDAGVDANAVDDDGYVPLHLVTSVESLVLLVEHGGADINKTALDGRTPLLMSTRHDAVTLKLLEYKPNCGVVDKEGNSALHLALKSWNASPEIVRGLLEGGADPNLKNRDGQTPLLCISEGHSSSSLLVDMLLNAGADIDNIDKEGTTIMFRMVATSSFGRNDEAHKDLKDLLSKGANPSLRDLDGRTMLHEAVKNYHTQSPFTLSPESDHNRLGFMLSLGLDIHAVDNDGNGLLHELALRSENHYSLDGSSMVLLWRALVDLGLDLQLKNHAGRTPLHVLCSVDTHSRNLVREKLLPIDFVISRADNVDDGDDENFTPLHIASTFGEFYVKKLLDAGADPTATTSAGFTPLHLAARYRESNVVGLLLSALRNQEIAANETLAVNATTSEEAYDLSPLDFACLSGRPETVALLLEHGADTQSRDFLRSCALFEDNDIMRKASQNDSHSRQPREKAVLKVEHMIRATFDGSYSQVDVGEDDATRLEEILSMLVEHGINPPLDVIGNSSFYVNDAFMAGKDYTAACLIEARDKYRAKSGDQEEGEPPTLAEMMYSSQRQALIQMLDHLSPIDVALGHALFNRSLIRREYPVIEELAIRGVSFLPSPENEVGDMSILIALGFSRLVEKVGTLESKSILGKGNWHAFGDETKPGLWYANRSLDECANPGQNPKPFLLQAVERELPNMDVLKLLVEKFVVDIDELYNTREHMRDEYAYVPSESALHYVAGGHHWWQVHQALPYLLKAGADAEIRNFKGQTPLHVALVGRDGKYGIFAKDAARLLMESGADVNAIDKEGNGCLSYAQYDPDMIRILKSHGATVTAPSLFAAIDARNVEVLTALLDGGIDANIRPDRAVDVAAPKTHAREYYRTGLEMILSEMEIHELFPLYYAAMQLCPTSVAADTHKAEIATGLAMARALLDHGSDPFAKFLKPLESDASSDGNEERQEPGTIRQASRECTLLHEALMNGARPDVLLSLRDVNVNERDVQGRTLLHVACLGVFGPDYSLPMGMVNGGMVEGGNDMTVFQHMLSLGADITALDGKGRNVLHCMMDDGRNSNDSTTFENALQETLKTAPDLVNQADSEGKTPLYYAASRAIEQNLGIAKLLLEAGANPLATTLKGDTILHALARGFGGDEIRAWFRDLVSQWGLDVNARNVVGETPIFSFFRAALKARNPSGWRWNMSAKTPEEQDEQDEALFAELAELEVDFCVRDARGRSLLHVAAAGPAWKFKRVMGRGVDVMWEDDAQQTAIDIAAACGNTEVLKLFEKQR